MSLSLSELTGRGIAHTEVHKQPFTFIPMDNSEYSMNSTRLRLECWEKDGVLVQKRSLLSRCSLQHTFENKSVFSMAYCVQIGLLLFPTSVNEHSTLKTTERLTSTAVAILSCEVEKLRGSSN